MGMAKKMKSMGMVVGEADGLLKMVAVVVAEDEETAAQMEGMANGMMAMAALGKDSKHRLADLYEKPVGDSNRQYGYLAGRVGHRRDRGSHREGNAEAHLRRLPRICKISLGDVVARECEEDSSPLFFNILHSSFDLNTLDRFPLSP